MTNAARTGNIRDPGDPGGGGTCGCRLDDKQFGQWIIHSLPRDVQTLWEQ